MVQHTALGIDTTEARARINTLEVLAGLVRGTLRICGAFWPACNIRVAKVLRYALAGGGSVPLGAASIGAAWRGVARIHNLCRSRPGCDALACRECIPSVAGVALAARQVVADSAGGVHTADTRARVPAVLVDAGLVAGTLGVDGALRLALDVRVADVVSDTLAGCSSAALGTLGISAAR